MNTQVNLIRPQELRSASMVSLKSLAWIVSVFVPLVFLLWIGWCYMGYREVASTLQLLEQERDQLAPQRREATTLRRTLRTQQEAFDEVMGWGRSRLLWHSILEEVRGHVPNTMQWRSLQMRMDLLRDANGRLLRRHALTLAGRCEGENAEAQVETMRQAWAAETPVAQWVRRAVVTAYQEDESPLAAKEDRTFEIEVNFHSRSFDALAGR